MGGDGGTEEGVGGEVGMVMVCGVTIRFVTCWNIQKIHLGYNFPDQGPEAHKICTYGIKWLDYPAINLPPSPTE